MKRVLLILMLLAAALPAWGQDTKLLIINGGSAIPGVPTTLVDDEGVRLIPPVQPDDGDADAFAEYYQPVGLGVAGADGQIMIPRYANGTGHPAGQVVGWGPMSTIQATAATEALPSATRALVITEDYDAATMKKYTFGASGAAAVLNPRISGLTLIGSDEVTPEDYTNNGDVSASTWEGAPDLYDLARLRGTGVEVADCNFFYFPGVALTIGSGGVESNGQSQPFDSLKPRVDRVKFKRGFKALLINAADAIVGDVEGSGIRDYVIKVTTGGVQFRGAVHTYGVGQDYPTGYILEPGVGVWFASGSGGCWGGPWYVETGHRGMLIETSGNTLHTFFSFAITYRNFEISGTNNRLTGGEVQMIDGQTAADGYAIGISNKNNTLRDWTIEAQSGHSLLNQTPIRLTGECRHIVLDNIRFATVTDTDTPLISVLCDNTHETLNHSLIRVFCQGDRQILDLYNDNGDEDGVRSRLGIGNTIIIECFEVGTPDASTPIKFAPNLDLDADNFIQYNGRRMVATDAGGVPSF